MQQAIGRSATLQALNRNEDLGGHQCALVFHGYSDLDIVQLKDARIVEVGVVDALIIAENCITADAAF